MKLCKVLGRVVVAAANREVVAINTHKDQIPSPPDALCQARYHQKLLGPGSRSPWLRILSTEPESISNGTLDKDEYVSEP